MVWSLGCNDKQLALLEGTEEDAPEHVWDKLTETHESVSKVSKQACAVVSQLRHAENIVVVSAALKNHQQTISDLMQHKGTMKDMCIFKLAQDCIVSVRSFFECHC